MYRILLLAVILSSLPLNAQWKRLLNERTFDMWANPKNFATMIVGGQGRVVYKTYDYGLHWDTLIVGYRGGAARFNNIFINPEDTNIYVVGGLLFGDMRVSTNAGKSWEISLQKDNPIALNGKSVVMKPDDPNVMYLGDFQTGTIFKSTNKGRSWDSISICTRYIKFGGKDTVINGKDTTLGGRDTLVGVKLGCLSIRTDSTNILVLGSTSGEMYMSTDNAVTWKFIKALKKPRLDVEDCEITRVDFSERDPRVGYGVITYLYDRNTPSGGVHKTTDGGYTWENIAFPDTSYWAVACRKNLKGDDDEVFIGGYTENYFSPDSTRIVGIGLVKRSTDGGKTWYSYDNTMDWFLEYPVNNEVYDMCFVDSENGYYCGQNGSIKYTDNAKDWDVPYYPDISVKENLYGIYFKDINYGYVVGEGGIILKSTNAGLTWSKYFTKEKTNLRSIRFNSKNEAFTLGDAGKFYSSKDSGKTWQNIDLKTTENLKAVIFNEKTGLAVGYNKSVYFSNDYGSNWSKADADIMKTGEGIVSVDYNSNTNEFFALTDLNNVYSIDMNIKIKLLKEKLHFRKLNSISIKNNNIFFSGDSGVILFSKNNLINIEQQYAPLKKHYYKVLAVNDTIAFVAGIHKTILRTWDTGKMWIINTNGGGPLANMWSMRYFGPLGKEKIYLASEAGLFVLDYPSYMEKLNNNQIESPLKAFSENGEILKISYKLKDLNSLNNLKLIVSNIKGQILFEKSFAKYSEVFEYQLDINNYSNGAYIIQMIDGKEGYSLIYLK
jgi:photosystem II stability/assembly factor-like uncharacterized protein